MIVLLQLFNANLQKVM